MPEVRGIVGGHRLVLLAYTFPCAVSGPVLHRRRGRAFAFGLGSAHRLPPLAAARSASHLSSSLRRRNFRSR